MYLQTIADLFFINNLQSISLLLWWPSFDRNIVELVVARRVGMRNERGDKRYPQNLRFTFLRARILRVRYPKCHFTLTTRPAQWHWAWHLALASPVTGNAQPSSFINNKQQQSKQPIISKSIAIRQKNELLLRQKHPSLKSAMIVSLDGLAIVHLSFIAYFAILHLRVEVSLKIILFSAAAAFAAGAIGSAAIARSDADDADAGVPSVPIKIEPDDLPAAISNSTFNAIKRAHQKQNRGGTIVRNASTHDCVAIEFYGPAGLDGRSIEVQYVMSSFMNKAKVFLQWQSYSIIDVSDSDFKELKVILMGNSKSTGRIDPASGCATFEGMIP